MKTTATIGSSAVAFPLPSLAVTVESVPNPRQEDDTWVTDMAAVLSDTTEVKLNQLITDLEAQNGSEIAVVTVPDTAPADSPKEFAADLFNYWGIGKADADNGILFLISTGERRIEIETGYGIEAILPDTQVDHIITEKIVPRLKQGDYDGGTLAGTQALITALQNPHQQTTDSVGQSGNFFGSVPFFGLLLILAVVIGLLFNRRKQRHGSAGRSHSTGGVIGSGGCSSGGSSGSSGGGGSFGGGSSGGGGAGGSY
ncbi:MAG: TPM domain-containing protein [Cyanophyceae cyanobacterium]